jgi:phage terminase large subunit
MLDINDKYKPIFFNKDKRYHIVTGGRGSGKSFAITLFLVLLTEQKNEVILFTRYTLISANISIIPEFLNMIELLGWGDRFTITKDQVVNNITGSKILFKGLKTSSGTQTANLKSLAGVTCWVLDEAEELIDETVFDKIDLSIRSKNAQNRVIMILNPTTAEHFIYNRWFSQGKKDNTLYVHTTYLDNKDNLDTSILYEIEQIRLTNIKKYNHIILGGWLEKAEGVIFENWQKGTFDTSIPVMYGMDFGFSNDPTTLVKVAVNWRHKKLYVQELHYNRDKGTSDVVNICRTIPVNSPIIADSAEPRLISDVRQTGINITSCIKGPDSVRAGIKLMQDFTIFVDHNSHNIIKELNNYVWNDKRSNTPVDNYNHVIDAIRYVVFYQKHARKTVKYTRR